jgi:hypothetical protein
MVNGFKAKVFCNYSALKLILRLIAKERTENNFYNVASNLSGFKNLSLDHQVFRLTTVTTRIVYKIRGSSFLKKNLNLEFYLQPCR